MLLIGILLGTTLAFFLLNAAHLFKKDNLDSIYLSSDILTSAKAGEVRTWFAGILNRTKGLGDKLKTSSEGEPLNIDVSIESEILAVQLFTSPSEASASEPLLRTRSWVASNLQKKNLTSAELEAEIKKFVTNEVRSKNPKTQMDRVVVRPFIAQSGKTLILLGSYGISKDNQPYLLGSVLGTEGLSEIFSKTGPYVFLLLDEHGRMLMSTEGSQDLTTTQLASLPIVKRMLTTRLERELQEFTFKDQVYLGAYQRLGIAGLSVLSQVAKSIALETGQTLIRRSIMIGLLLFLAAFIFTYLFVQRLIGPILELRTAAKKMSQGNFDVRVDVDSRDEIFDLAASFNTMSAELEQKIKNLYRINEASGKIRSISNNAELLDFAVEFLMSLLSCELGLGLYFGGKKDPETGKPKVHYSKNNWPSSTISLKKLIASLAQTKGITQCWIEDLPFLVCPIFHQANLVGIIILGGRKEKKAFQPEEHFMARTVVSMVSADSENIQYQSELRELNEDLENRVVLRTQELATANVNLKEQKKELDDVMNNIQQGILTINDNMVINTDYSRYTNLLFGLNDIGNLNICDLLFPGADEERRKENLKDWLGSIFLDPSIFESIQDFGLKELEFPRKNEDGTSDLRFLSFQWRPIYEEEQIIKIMLVCFDLTEQKRLEREILKQEEGHKEELEIIAKLVNNPAEVVEQFIGDFSRNLTTGMKLFEGLKAQFEASELNGLMRVLHTLKGSAKQFGLDSVQSKANSLEEQVSNWIRTPPTNVDIPALLEKCYSEFKLIEETLQRMISVYEKIMKGGASGGSSQPVGGKPMVSIPLEKFESLLSRMMKEKGEIKSSTVKQSLAWLLQTPIAPLFQRLEKLALTLTKELQYEAKITIQGGETNIDLRLLPVLYDAFLHVIRNSIDHGGETPQQRMEKGKPGPIQLNLSAEALPSGVLKVKIGDDGKGIHDEIVLRKAIEKGLVSAEKGKSLPHEEVIMLIFMPGFSTKEAVTDISGRGVGMDVVKETIEKTLKGKLQVTSQIDKGTQIEFTFPSMPRIS